MKRRRGIMLVLGCVLAGLAVFYLVGFDHEPRYGGRSLSAWLLISQEIWSGKLTRPGWQESSEAIRRMGTNGLPYVLEWMAYERPSWRTQVVAKLQKLPKALGGGPKLERWVLGQGEARADATIWAFKALGAEARPIVPELFELAYGSKNPATSRRAEAALDNLGADALGPLLAAIASGKIKHRAGAISWITAMRRVDMNMYTAPTRLPMPVLNPQVSRSSSLGTTASLAVPGLLPMPGLNAQVSRSSSLGTNASLAVPVLLRCLEDKDLKVALEATRALGVLRLAADTVVPALAAKLEDPRTPIRIQAAVSLSYFQEQARPAMPALLKALNDADDMVRYQATNTLENIAPEIFTGKKSFFRREKRMEW